MNHYERESIVKSAWDGNHVNGDLPDRVDHPEDCGCDFCNLNYGHRKCGFCGDIKADRGKVACEACLNDQAVKEYLDGK